VFTYIQGLVWNISPRQTGTPRQSTNNTGKTSHGNWKPVPYLPILIKSKHFNLFTQNSHKYLSNSWRRVSG